MHGIRPVRAKRLQIVATIFAGALATLGAVSAQASIVGFEGISQYDTRDLGRNFIPPDTMGAVGTTQYMEFVNGAVAVYDKATHTRTQLISDVAFWAAAGQTGANGDSRVLFDHASQRWIATSLGNNVADIQIAVSQTANALGPWKSVKFTGFAGGTADYPTLGMDGSGVYIGTNNFNAAGNFRATSLFSIPKSDLFSSTPTLANITRFDNLVTFNGVTLNDTNHRGFTMQGAVDNTNAPGNGNIISIDFSVFAFDKFKVINPGAPGATLSASTILFTTPYNDLNKGHQPDGTVAMDTGDDRNSSNVYKMGNNLYFVHTEGGIGAFTGHTVQHWFVVNAATGALVDQGVIGDTEHDSFYGSLAVNALGQVLVGYNRSGSGADGNASFFASSFITGADGLLVDTSDVLLKSGLVGDYHCYVHFGTPGCRERWGDFGSVSVDPTNQSFWAIGEFTREYNDAAGGHPGGTGGSRWSTWIANVSFGPDGRIPEPETITLLALGLLGIAATRRRKH